MVRTACLALHKQLKGLDFDLDDVVAKLEEMQVAENKDSGGASDVSRKQLSRNFIQKTLKNIAKSLPQAPVQRDFVGDDDGIVKSTIG